MRLQRLLLGVVCCACCAVSAPSSAVLIRVEPNRFPIGTDIRSSFPGVTLSVVSQPDTAIVPAIGTSVFLGGANIATTGRKVFARSPRGDCPLDALVDAAKTWSARCGLLRADFATPTDFVSIDVIFDDDDAGFLAAFDSAGTLLEQVDASGDGRGARPFARLRLNRLVRDIMFITAGGISAEGLYLDNLRFKRYAIPEPATLLLIGIALAAIRSYRRKRGSGR